MWTADFWKAAAERAIKTFVQALVAALTVGGALTVAGVDWKAVLLTAGATTLLSLITSVAGIAIGPSGSPSLVVDPAAAVPPATAVEPPPVILPPDGP